MIREERSAAFWNDIAAHPAVAGAMLGMPPHLVGLIASNPGVLPLASDNGGFLFVARDVEGMVLELHSLYRPAGWGREVATAGKEALQWVFRTAQAIFTYEVQGNERSQPPRSYGFAMASDWQAAKLGTLRVWVLTRMAWETSPAHRRIVKCQ